MTLASNPAENANRLGPFLGFQRNLAEQFERDTAAQRVRELRQAIFIALVFFNLYSLAAIVVLPDVLVLAVVLRLGVMTPVALGIAWGVGRLPHVWRERAVLAGSLGAAAVPVVLLWASHAPEAAYSAGDLTLSMLFSTMMLVLRFPHALAFVVIVLLLAVPSYYLKTANSTALGHALVLQLVCSACYLLFGNYRIERKVRTAYLHTHLAVLRSASLQVDKTELRRVARIDPLTGVANRRRLSEWLAAWEAGTGPRCPDLAAIMIDVDHFKRYNDAYGHPAGDACLQRIAEALAACVRDDRDLLARYGGEEFAIVLPHASPAEAAAVAERLCGAVEALGLPHAHRGDGLAVVTISAGVAATTPGVAPLPGHPALFEAADTALYGAKRAGRNRYAVAAEAVPRQG